MGDFSSSTLLLLVLIANVEAGVYLHNPPGSNNRLNGESRVRKNNNRLFDSQNNNRGGYNVGGYGNVEGEAAPTFITGSTLNIQWTNENECGLDNTGCDIILQYMCDDTLRDGVNTATPSKNRDNNLRHGRHETQQYFQDCKNRKRDTNLFNADQKLTRGDATATRQNPNGVRSGLECPEERDYFPYHAPTPWRDIAILTNHMDKCDTYKRQSQNVNQKGFCKGAVGLQPITDTACLAAGGIWGLESAHGLPAPDCLKAPQTRDNHLGNVAATGDGTERVPKTAAYNWKLPPTEARWCIIRIRYNISAGDYSRNGNPTVVAEMAEKYNLTGGVQEARNRGYYVKTNPKIKPMTGGKGLDFQLAIKTNQIGRTFEDRTHKFHIGPRPADIPKSADIHNLNVIGKRGNIVQVYPAVEYGFEPADLKVKKNDYVHVQWTGSLKNPKNNDGEGSEGEDKNNLILMENRRYPSSSQPPNSYGHPANSYPLSIDKYRFLGVDIDIAKKLAFPTTEKRKNDGKHGNAANLDDAPSYVNARVKAYTLGTWYYMCTRNNNFSKRSQKGKVQVVP